ncbi:MAG: hypothetical protein IJ733_01580, partial [Lachnospiraceae bacterium]|nr:hypothetical protein [Lachnospiraceae bacterium]
HPLTHEGLASLCVPAACCVATNIIMQLCTYYFFFIGNEVSYKEKKGYINAALFHHHSHSQ